METDEIRKKTQKMAKNTEKWREITENAWRELNQDALDQALKYLDSLSAEDTVRPEVGRLRARIAWMRGFPEAAVLILEKALDDVPSDEACRLDLAVLYLQAHRLADVEAMLGALGAYATSARARMARYAVDMERGDTAAARRQLQAAVAALIAVRGRRRYPDPTNAPLFPSRLLED